MSCTVVHTVRCSTDPFALLPSFNVQLAPMAIPPGLRERVLDQLSMHFQLLVQTGVLAVKVGYDTAMETNGNPNTTRGSTAAGVSSICFYCSFVLENISARAFPNVTVWVGKRQPNVENALAIAVFCVRSSHVVPCCGACRFASTAIENQRVAQCGMRSASATNNSCAVPSLFACRPLQHMIKRNNRPSVCWSTSHVHRARKVRRGDELVLAETPR